MEIKIYSNNDDCHVFTYTEDMVPEIFPESEGKIIDGPFDIYYLSGFEEEDGTEYTSCHYSDDYYAIIERK